MEEEYDDEVQSVTADVLEESDVIDPDHYVLEFHKIKMFHVVYECRHGSLVQSIGIKNPEIKRCTIHKSVLQDYTSSTQIVYSLSADHGLNLPGLGVHEIASHVMAIVRRSSRSSSPQRMRRFTVAKVIVNRSGDVNRCLNHWRSDSEALVNLGMNLEVYYVGGGTKAPGADELEEIDEDDTLEQNYESTVYWMLRWFGGLPTVLDPESFPCLRYDNGSGDHDNLICSICLAEFSTGDEFFRTACLHDFHKRCIASWMMENCTCPLCRQGIQL